MYICKFAYVYLLVADWLERSLSGRELRLRIFPWLICPEVVCRGHGKCLETIPPVRQFNDILEKKFSVTRFLAAKKFIVLKFW